MSEEDREWFLDQLKSRAKAQGKQLNLIGKAAFEQRQKDESDNTFSPKPQQGPKLQPPQRGTPEEQMPSMRNYTEDHLSGMQELQDKWEEEAGPARDRFLSSSMPHEKSLTKQKKKLK